MNDYTNTIGLICGVVALIVGVIAYVRSGKPITIQGIEQTLEQGQALAAELREVAEAGVTAAQQLKESGKIVSNSEAYQHAFAHVQKWFPDLDPQLVANAIEAAYYGVKVAKQQRVNWNS